MAIKGDLKDITLATLIQMFCLDRQSAALFLKNGAKEGVIFFSNGNIVHAKLEDTEGEEAVYQLLSWTKGTFQMLAKEKMPNTTIVKSWNQILLDGMRRIDEESSRLSESGIEDIIPTASEQNDDIGNYLIILLSGLEQMLYKLSHKKNIKRPATALGIITGIVNEVVAFSEKQLNADVNNDSLAKTLAKAGETYPRICLLQAEHNRLSEKTVLNLYNGWAADPSGRMNTFRQVTLGMVDVLRTYFWLFNSCFRSPSLAEQHKELCDVFLSGIMEALEKIKF